MIPIRTQEALAGWLALGLLAALAMPAPAPALLICTTLPWLVGSALLLRFPATALAGGLAAQLTRDPAGRLTLLTAVTLLTVVGVVITPFSALLLLIWCGAASLVLGTGIGPERLRGVWRRAVLMGGAIALVCALLEGVFRLPFVERRLGSPAEEAAWERRYDRVADENIFGLRSVHQTMARTPGVRRILALGDSFTWGEKVASTDSIWPTRLEADLTRRSPAHPTEVVNLSRRGWSTAEEVRMLNLAGWQFQSDRLLLQYFLNDVELPEAVPRIPIAPNQRPR